ncbi:hypothetical protein [Luteimonas aquatica]|uniref:hypothetical protein n=1 Tax=Luteimonas aquatica TaxID=450364 RepID=UPI001F577E02|nr:hypothetical protein [Luteimonas aquatica]
MSRFRKRGVVALLALAAMLAAGATLARWPVLGEEWAEWTRYDGSGNAIGGGRIECDGSIQTWGDAGDPIRLQLHRCN